ncbi:diguanylate cyclase (GGDEF) domain-containing protein [Salinihabitans flavidus]|uniref:diguanylate cyclase n=2 Tax=Salinihabitans flavidus TaxID=569882 RepID=A0A1H8QAZ5_9RHOB|nr:diguanylate cyclase (GGDEF) domain-containing protein [Salinihabitans flavidus]
MEELDVQILQVTSKSEATRLSVGLTLVMLTIVTVIYLLYFPPDAWPQTLMVALPTTLILTFSATYLVTQQMLRVHALNTELQRLVSRDRLTDVATRDFFFARLAERPGSFGVSLMVDIDKFKVVNDTYGHPAGDKVIANVARILAQEVCARDIVCRFGGEEFVIFLDNATATIALETSERIRVRVESSKVDSEGRSVTVTVSIGGSLRQAAAEIETAIRQADAALYCAKHLGRNQVVMFSDLSEMPETAAGHSTSIRSLPRTAAGH